MSSSQLSVFIPRCDLEITDSFIAETFQRYMNLGSITRIDRVSKMDYNCTPFVALYIHFDNVYSNSYVEAFLNGKVQKLYYSNTQYWNILQNTATKHTSGDRKLRIQLDPPTIVKPTIVNPNIVTPIAKYPITIAPSLTYAFPKHILVDVDQYNSIIQSINVNTFDDESTASESESASITPIDIDSESELEDGECEMSISSEDYRLYDNAYENIPKDSQFKDALYWLAKIETSHVVNKFIKQLSESRRLVEQVSNEIESVLNEVNV